MTNELFYRQLLERREFHAKELQRTDDMLALYREMQKGGAKAARMMDKVRERATGEPTTRSMTAAAFARQHRQPYDRATLGAEARRLVALAAEQGLTFRYPTIYQFLLVDSKTAPGATAPASSAQPTVRDFIEQHHGNPKARNYQEASRLIALAKAEGLSYSHKAFESMLRRMARGVVAPGGTRNRADTLRAQRDASARRKAGTSPTDYVRAVMRTATTPLTRDDIIEQAKLRERTRNPKFVNQSAIKILEAMQRSKEVRKTSAGYVAYKLKAQDVARDNGAHA